MRYKFIDDVTTVAGVARKRGKIHIIAATPYTRSTSSCINRLRRPRWMRRTLFLFQSELRFEADGEVKGWRPPKATRTTSSPTRKIIKLEGILIQRRQHQNDVARVNQFEVIEIKKKKKKKEKEKTTNMIMPATANCSKRRLNPFHRVSCCDVIMDWPTKCSKRQGLCRRRRLPRSNPWQASSWRNTKTNCQTIVAPSSKASTNCVWLGASHHVGINGR